MATIQIKAKRLDLESSDTLQNLYQEVLDQIRIELKSVTNQQMANEKGIHAVIKNRAKLQKEGHGDLHKLVEEVKEQYKKNFDPEFGKLPDAVYSLEKLVVPYLVEEEEGLRGLESDSRVSYKRAASATNAELKSVESRVKNVARHAKARAAKVYSKIDELEGEIRGLKAKERKARLRLRTAREEAVEDTHTMTSDLEREVQKASRAMRRDGRREVKNYEVPLQG